VLFGKYFLFYGVIAGSYAERKGEPFDQDLKAPILSKIDGLIDSRWIGEIEGDLGKNLLRIKNSLKKKALGIEDLPDDLVQNFKDLSGTVGTFAFIYPRGGMPLSDGRNLMRFASVVSDIHLLDGRVMHATGEYRKRTGRTSRSWTVTTCGTRPNWKNRLPTWKHTVDAGCVTRST
jgi:hypothetical protein